LLLVYSAAKNSNSVDGSAPPANNVYSNSSVNNSILNTALGSSANPNFMNPEGVVRVSASRAGAPRGSAQAPVMLPQQTIEMSKTFDEMK